MVSDVSVTVKQHFIKRYKLQKINMAGHLSHDLSDIRRYNTHTFYLEKHDVKPDGETGGRQYPEKPDQNLYDHVCSGT